LVLVYDSSTTIDMSEDQITYRYLGNLDIALLLDVEEGDSVGVVEREHPGGTRVRHLVAVGGWKLLSHCVLQVLVDRKTEFSAAL